MSARAWVARRARRDRTTRGRDADDLKAQSVDARRELLTAAACPYWRHVALAGPLGTCGPRTCWEVPVCMDIGPVQSRRDRRTLRRTGRL